jgi:hypothetical protein
MEVKYLHRDIDPINGNPREECGAHTHMGGPIRRSSYTLNAVCPHSLNEWQKLKNFKVVMFIQSMNETVLFRSGIYHYQSEYLIQRLKMEKNIWT